MNTLQILLFEEILKELKTYDTSTHNVSGAQYDHYYWVLKKKGLSNKYAEIIVNKLTSLIDSINDIEDELAQ